MATKSKLVDYFDVHSRQYLNHYPADMCDAPTEIETGILCPKCRTDSLFECGSRPPLMGGKRRRTEFRCFICGCSTVKPIKEDDVENYYVYKCPKCGNPRLTLSDKNMYVCLQMPHCVESGGCG